MLKYAVAAVLLATGCASTPDKPLWVTSPPSEPAFILGVGFAVAGDRNREEALEAAKANARTEIARIISTQILSDLEMLLVEISNGDSTAVRETMVEKTTQRVNRDVKGARVRTQWFDEAQNGYWVLAELPVAVFERHKRLQEKEAAKILGTVVVSASRKMNTIDGLLARGAVAHAASALEHVYRMASRGTAFEYAPSETKESLTRLKNQAEVQMRDLLDAIDVVVTNQNMQTVAGRAPARKASLQAVYQSTLDGRRFYGKGIPYRIETEASIGIVKEGQLNRTGEVPFERLAVAGQPGDAVAFEVVLAPQWYTIAGRTPPALLFQVKLSDPRDLPVLVVVEANGESRSTIVEKLEGAANRWLEAQGYKTIILGSTRKIPAFQQPAAYIRYDVGQVLEVAAKHKETWLSENLVTIDANVSVRMVDPGAASMSRFQDLNKDEDCQQHGAAGALSLAAETAYDLDFAACGLQAFSN